VKEWGMMMVEGRLRDEGRASASPGKSMGILFSLPWFLHQLAIRMLPETAGVDGIGDLLLLHLRLLLLLLLLRACSIPPPLLESQAVPPHLIFRHRCHRHQLSWNLEEPTLPC